MSSWYTSKGPENDVIISSRIRLARNFAKFPFPSKISHNDAQEVTNIVRDTILNGGVYLSKFSFNEMSKTGDIDKVALIEKHLISPDLVKNSSDGSVLISEDESISIMMNEEDHLRIQSIFPGMQLNKAFDISDKIDDVVEARLDYAFDEKIGYLTSCPTNVGTGMRASVMVHLPALTMIGYINGLLSTISKLGIAVRGIYGEGSQALGSIYQISNQITLGQSEDDILNNLNGVIHQIIEQERMARNKMLKESGIQLEDKICRSFGILTNARLLSSNECMSLLSELKLGIDLKLIDGFTTENILELMVITQPALLQKVTGKILDEKERDQKRAELVRKKLSNKEA